MEAVTRGAVALRLELSSEGRYALRALLYLAWAGERVTADGIAAEARVPRRLLARILAKLSRAGLVESEQGRGGGSWLARPADEITLREAVEAVEGPFGVFRCIMENRACGESAPCVLHDAWEEGQRAILEYLDGQTLEEFVSRTIPETRAVSRRGRDEESPMLDRKRTGTKRSSVKRTGR